MKKEKRKQLTAIPFGTYLQALEFSEFASCTLSDGKATNSTYDAISKWFQRTHKLLTCYLKENGFKSDLYTPNTTIFMCNLLKMYINEKYPSQYNPLFRLELEENTIAYIINRCLSCGKEKYNKVANNYNLEPSINRLSFFLHFFTIDIDPLVGTPYALSPENKTKIKDIKDNTEDSPPEIMKKFMAIFFEKNNTSEEE